jgi:hypothetical protein
MQVIPTPTQMREAYRLSAANFLQRRNTIALISGSIGDSVDAAQGFRRFVESSIDNTPWATRRMVSDRIHLPYPGSSVARSRVSNTWLAFTVLQDTQPENLPDLWYVWCDEAGDYECVDGYFFQRFRPVSVYRPRVTLKKRPKGVNGWTRLRHDP